VTASQGLFAMLRQNEAGGSLTRADFDRAVAKIYAQVPNPPLPIICSPRTIRRARAEATWCERTVKWLSHELKATRRWRIFRRRYLVAQIEKHRANARGMRRMFGGERFRGA